eukprot:TRINITY_DN1819_c0_g2_i2.p1 TRINITY_DN1819_c0_g2~~TRINITY_DN1819_c0_g2_i2.p1  ORF type:complete len:183 (-),score=41.42 TRINITY_DN1819_c0_g2_i2:24-572(-)
MDQPKTPVKLTPTAGPSTPNKTPSSSSYFSPSKFSPSSFFSPSLLSPSNFSSPSPLYIPYGSGGKNSKKLFADVDTFPSTSTPKAKSKTPTPPNPSTPPPLPTNQPIISTPPQQLTTSIFSSRSKNLGFSGAPKLTIVNNINSPHNTPVYSSVIDPSATTTTTTATTTTTTCLLYTSPSPRD